MSTWEHGDFNQPIKFTGFYFQPVNGYLRLEHASLSRGISLFLLSQQSSKQPRLSCSQKVPYSISSTIYLHKTSHTNEIKPTHLWSNATCYLLSYFSQAIRCMNSLRLITIPRQTEQRTRMPETRWASQAKCTKDPWGCDTPQPAASLQWAGQQAYAPPDGELSAYFTENSKEWS